MPPVIVADRLTKYYGKSRGVEDLSFEVRQGEVFGFLGPNGAGKSTTIRTMLDLIRATSGRLSVFGLDTRRDAPRIHRRVGYMPGEFGLYERLTGEQYLRDFSGFRGGVDQDYVREVAKRVKLDLDVRIKSLSHGNKRKVGLVQAFMAQPELLVLDEPTQGLDPLVQQEFYSLVDEARVRGHTVFMSSHVMPEVERVCDRVAIIREGRLITIDDVGELKAKALRKISLHFGEPIAAAAFTSLPSVVSADTRGGDEIELTVRGTLDAVVKEAARYEIINISTHEPSLEDIFLDVYRNGGEA
jgi:ABC-2 type transport system ATP-binding protein